MNALRSDSIKGETNLYLQCFMRDLNLGNSLFIY